MTPGRFRERVVLVAGSTGMAASAARRIAAEGGRVWIVSRTPEHARRLADDIGRAGGEAGWHAADLTQEDQVSAAVGTLLARWERIDAAYTVAGISGRRFGDGALHDATLEGWQTVLASNATSQFLVCRAVVRQMLAQPRSDAGTRGSIVTMSSVLGRHPAPEHFATHAYAASKGAIEAFSTAIAAYYAPHGIRVNVVAPALVATPMSRRAQDDPQVLDYLTRRQPLAGGPIDADAVTATALHLLSDEAAMVTGQVVGVDAGWSVSDAGPQSEPSDRSTSNETSSP